jgi:hypothetical protein
MKCDYRNGYAGWTVRDVVTNQPEPYVIWVDPDDNTYATVDTPTRIDWKTGEVAQTVHRVKDFIIDVPACTFWFEKLAVTVPPLRSGNDPKVPTNKPCDACRQPETCKRIDFCAAYRCRFGEDD